MGFTFVADRATRYRLLSTSPRGNAVAGPSSLNGLIRVMSSFISSGFEFQDRTKRQRVDASERLFNHPLAHTARGVSPDFTSLRSF